MTALLWGTPSKRFYETGVERGVLYLPGLPGVAWNGIRGINENPQSGSTESYYLDGVKYLNVSGKEEFSATLEAYTYPDEFEVCDGTAEMFPGLLATAQPRRPFGLTYTTNIGNDVDGVSHAYKLHLLYNAMAAPSAAQYTTLDTDPEPIAFSWDLSAVPVIHPGIRPTSHFVLDSRRFSPLAMTAIRDALYGTPSTDPYLPEVFEIINILETLNDFAVINNGNGSYVVSGDAVSVEGATFTVNHENATDNGDDTFTIFS